MEGHRAKLGPKKTMEEELVWFLPYYLIHQIYLNWFYLGTCELWWSELLFNPSKYLYSYWSCIDVWSFLGVFLFACWRWRLIALLHLDCLETTALMLLIRGLISGIIFTLPGGCSCLLWVECFNIISCNWNYIFWWKVGCQRDLVCGLWYCLDCDLDLVCFLNYFTLSIEVHRGGQDYH